MTDKDKHRFAVHEVGHLLVGYKQEDLGGQAVHKVSIVQRTRIGGHVRLLSDDRSVSTEEDFRAFLATLAGGFAAEEIYCGQNVSTGPSSDLMQLTRIARMMVEKWAMGDRKKLGLRTYGAESQARFLYSQGVRDIDFSPETARLIDEEVARLTGEAEQTAKRVLFDNKEKFEFIVRELEARETIQGEEVREMLAEPVPEN